MQLSEKSNSKQKLSGNQETAFSATAKLSSKLSHMCCLWYSLHTSNFIATG